MNIDFNRNEDANRMLASNMERKLTKVYQGGGPKRIEKLHAEGKMTARERIAFLIDKESQTIEIGAFVGEDMYEEHGGCPWMCRRVIC
jgi:acetyl-CoA carboxylase carboxyltransferase component